LIAAISYYDRVALVSTWVAVARTRAFSRLSAAGFTGVTTARLRGEAQAVSNEKPQLTTQRHRLPQVGHERVPGAPALAHHPIL